MTTGKVTWFSDAKGYGFIHVAEQQQDVFVHYSDIEDDPRTLTEGSQVQLAVENDDKTARARHVQTTRL